MDLFEEKNISPMLIKNEMEPFDDPEYIYELKLDGIRCIAFLDSKEKTEFYNKRKMLLNPHFQELLKTHENISGRCILDGEILIMRNGKPNFADVQKRALTNDSYKLKLQAKRLPASFIAYGILFYRGKEITKLPLLERKKKLELAIKQEDSKFSYMRYVIEKGTELFNLTTQRDLQGIVAKHMKSKYYQNRQSKDWIKIKNMLDDNFIICGYILKNDYIRTLVLGQYSEEKKLLYKGHVTGISKQVFNIISKLPEVNCPFTDLPRSNENTRWIKRNLVCRVEFMEYTRKGGMR